MQQKYFTTFADVNTDNHRQYDKTYGKDWKPFSYDKRLQDSVKVSRKNLNWQIRTMQRVQKGKNLHHTFLVLKSRQEEVPLVKHFISVA